MFCRVRQCCVLVRFSRLARERVRFSWSTWGIVCHHHFQWWPWENTVQSTSQLVSAWLELNMKNLIVLTKVSAEIVLIHTQANRHSDQKVIWHFGSFGALSCLHTQKGHRCPPPSRLRSGPHGRDVYGRLQSLLSMSIPVNRTRCWVNRFEYGRNCMRRLGGEEARRNESAFCCYVRRMECFSAILRTRKTVRFDICPQYNFLLSLVLFWYFSVI